MVRDDEMFLFKISGAQKQKCRFDRFEFEGRYEFHREARPPPDGKSIVVKSNS